MAGKAEIMSSDLLHADDTPIRVLDRSLRNKGLGKGVRQDQIWAYVRDQRPYSPGEVRGSVPQPNWAYMHAELRRKGVTLSLLWEEYRGVYPDGYGYSRYCELYTRWGTYLRRHRSESERAALCRRTCAFRKARSSSLRTTSSATRPTIASSPISYREMIRITVPGD